MPPLSSQTVKDETKCDFDQINKATDDGTDVKMHFEIHIAL